MISKVNGRFAIDTALCSLCLSMLAGCAGLTTKFVGAEQGYLFYGFDVLTVPGKAIKLRARLQQGPYLSDQQNQLIRFYHGKRFYAQALTDEEGYAAVVFVPREAGDYFFHAVHANPHKKGITPSPAPLLVACRAPRTPIAVVDVDKTLVASPFSQVLLGEPEPMPDSRNVLARMARQYTIVYLTYRPDHFGPKTKRWLEQHEYPRGPLLTSRFEAFLAGGEQFKTNRLRQLSRDFTVLRVGIGDKPADVRAYKANGVQTIILILDLLDMDDAEDWREEAQKLNDVPADVHVVSSWRQIEKILYEGASYPRPRVQAEMLHHAETLESRQ